MSDRTPSELEIELRRPKGRRQVSIVWLVPLLAIAIALVIFAQALSNRGPLIEIHFAQADGVVENETELRYRDVHVGTVERVTFSENLDEVVVSIRLDREIAHFVDQDATFWIVSPEVSAQGVTGLSTLLGGVYIQGTWDAEPGTTQSEFDGLPQPPLFTGTEEGRRIVLNAPIADGVGAGAPIFYKGVEVGVIDRPRLTDDGGAVTGNAFIRAPYHDLVNTASRFWVVSAVSLSISTSGIDFDIGNLTTLLRGGVAFDTIGRDPQDIADGTEFEVYPSREDAGTATPLRTDGPELVATAIFNTTVEGLQPGSPVTYGGIEIGSVVDTRGSISAPEAGAPPVQLRVDFRILPDRLGITGMPMVDHSVDQTAALIERMVADGYRLRLSPQGLLGRSLQLDLRRIRNAEPATVMRDGRGRLVVPTVAVDLPDPAMTARDTMRRLRNLPIEEIAEEIRSILAGVNMLVSSDGTQQVPDEVSALIADARALVAGPEITATLDAAEAALTGVATIISQIDQSSAVEAVVAALDRSDRIAQGLERAAGALPDLLIEIEALAAEARALPLDDLLEEANAVLAAARAVAEDPATQGLPTQLASAMSDLEATVAEARSLTVQLNDPDAVDAVLTALRQTDDIAASLGAASDGLPDLVATINRVAEGAEALPLPDLVAEATALVAAGRALAEDPQTTAVPAQLNAALGEVEAAASAVSEFEAALNDPDAVAALLEALRQTDDIASSLAAAADGLPALVAQIEAVAANAADLPLDTLVAETTALVTSAEALVSSDDTARLPATLAAALDELAAAIAELRDGGTVENVNATFASARSAADAISAAAGELPALADQLQTLVARADRVLAAYGDRSEFNTQTLAALSDLRESARAVTSLARAIERKPNSLLIGR